MREMVIFAEKCIDAASKSTNGEVKSWRPTLTTDFCCLNCGVNHETRDFARALILHALEHAESGEKYVELLKKNQSITPKLLEIIKSNEEETQENEEETEEIDF